MQFHAMPRPVHAISHAIGNVHGSLHQQSHQARMRIVKSRVMRGYNRIVLHGVLQIVGIPNSPRDNGVGIKRSSGQFARRFLLDQIQRLLRRLLGKIRACVM